MSRCSCFVTIIDGKSDNQALAFLEETIEVRKKKRLKAFLEHGLMDHQHGRPRPRDLGTAQWRWGDQRVTGTETTRSFCLPRSRPSARPSDSLTSSTNGGARGRDRQIVRFRARGVGARGWHRETVTCVGASSFAITASAMRNASFDRRQPTRAPQLCLRDRQWEKGRLRTPSARPDRCALQSHFAPPQNFCMERHVARLQKPRWTSGPRIRLRSSAAELS